MMAAAATPAATVLPAAAGISVGALGSGHQPAGPWLVIGGPRAGQSLPRSSAPVAATFCSCLDARSRYYCDLATSVWRVPMVAAMVSRAATLNVSMASIVA